MSKFTQLSQAEVQFLVDKKLGRTEWAVYCCLAAHSQNKSYSFPKIETICEWLGGQRNRKTIEKALKGLVDKGCVQRGHRSSKKRWVLVPRLSATSNNENPSKLEVIDDLDENNGSKLEVMNPSKLEGLNPSKLDPIKEKRKDKENISIPNEGDLSAEDIKIADRIKEDSVYEIKMILQDYDNYSRITGVIFSDHERQVLRNQMKIKGSHKWNLMKISVRNWKANPLMFRRRETGS